MRSHLEKNANQLVLAGLSLVLLAVLSASPSLLGDRVREAVAGLGSASPLWLWAAALGFASTSPCGALAWRAAIRAGGTAIARGDAMARYCVGSGVNAVAPAHLGSAVRLALFGRVTHGGCWVAGGAAAAVGITRTIWLGALIAFGCLTGVLPWWPLLAIAALLAGAIALALLSSRFPLPGPLQQALAALQGLAGSPRDLAVVAGWAFAGAALKIAATASVVAGLEIEHPLRAALVVVPAVELAAVMPVTPGNVGLATAAAAFALGSLGVVASTALAAGLAFGAIELLAGLGVGAAGVIAMTGPYVRPGVRTSAAAATSGIVLTGFALTVLFPVA